MKVEKEVMDLSLEWISFDNLRIEENEYQKLSNFMVEMSVCRTIRQPTKIL